MGRALSEHQSDLAAELVLLGARAKEGILNRAERLPAQTEDLFASPFAALESPA
jgi:hypothetical protein